MSVAYLSLFSVRSHQPQFVDASIRIRNLIVALLIIVSLCSPTTSFGQIDSAKATQFAIKPNPNAADSIQLFANYFRDKGDLVNWLRIYLLAGMEDISDSTGDKERGMRWLDHTLKPRSRSKSRQSGSIGFLCTCMLAMLTIRLQEILFTHERTTRLHAQCIRTPCKNRIFTLQNKYLSHLETSMLVSGTLRKPFISSIRQKKFAFKTRTMEKPALRSIALGLCLIPKESGKMPSSGIKKD